MFEPVRFEPRRLASVRSAPEVLALGFLPLESAAPKPTPSSEACISAPPRKSTPISRAPARVAPRIEAPRRSALDRSDLDRSEEHTSELQSLMRISYAVFGLKKKNDKGETIERKRGK